MRGRSRDVRLEIVFLYFSGAGPRKYR